MNEKSSRVSLQRRKRKWFIGSATHLEQTAWPSFFSRERRYPYLKIVDGPNMSLACLVCHSVESPSHSFGGYSVSSSDDKGRCATIANCIARKSSFPSPRGHSSIASSSKVTPQPANPSNDGMTGPPRLVRSRAVRRDIVRDWNFDEVEMDR